jgi:arginyl-tRNA synthetase
MKSLTALLSEKVGQAFAEENLDTDLGLVRVSDRPDLAQFQCNGAMAAAKVAKTNPREIAQKIVERLEPQGLYKKLEIAGPGFINIVLKDEILIDHLQSQMADERLGVKQYGNNETVIIDYVGANIAKAMHAGHIRPTIIGDCIKRLVSFAGYNALGDVHIGDWGLPMGQIISEFELRHPEWPYFDESFSGDYPENPPFTYAELEKTYPEASQACKNSEDRLELARAATAKLQDGHAGYTALWRHFLSLSKTHIMDNMTPMGVTFEIWKGESDVNHLIPEIADQLKEKNILVENDGAQIIDVKREEDKKELPPLLFFKSNGAVTYGTTDLGTIYDRLQTYGDIDHMIYVVDKRQNLHFQQVFRASEKAGYTENGLKLTHIGFGTLNGADGKPFKTRSGGIPRFDELLNDARQKAKSRIEDANLAADMSEDTKEKIANDVAVAALKFSDLLNQPHMDYAFDLDRMSSFEGKTGPYLLYQAVRIQSLLRKASDLRSDLEGDIVIEDESRNLVLLLMRLPDVFDLTFNGLSPHYLCEYIYSLAQEFSRFYGACHIMSEDNDALRESRLQLCEMTLSQLHLCLDLLGITIPEKM